MGHQLHPETGVCEWLLPDLPQAKRRHQSTAHSPYCNMMTSYWSFWPRLGPAGPRSVLTLLCEAKGGRGGTTLCSTRPGCLSVRGTQHSMMNLCLSLSDPALRCRGGDGPPAAVRDRAVRVAADVPAPGQAGHGGCRSGPRPRGHHQNRVQGEGAQPLGSQQPSQAQMPPKPVSRVRSDLLFPSTLCCEKGSGCETADSASDDGACPA